MNLEVLTKIRKYLKILLVLKNIEEEVKTDLFKYGLVRLERLELSPGNPTWPSTKLVYQFQHSRFVRQNK